MKLSPAPILKIIGRLNSFAPLLASLELTGLAQPKAHPAAPSKVRYSLDPLK